FAALEGSRRALRLRARGARPARRGHRLAAIRRPTASGHHRRRVGPGGPGRGDHRRLRRALQPDARNHLGRGRGRVLPAAPAAPERRGGGASRVAVYTDVTADDLTSFLADYDLGELLAYKGIAEGVETSNFLLHTGRGYFILMLYERRANTSDLPFLLGLK